MSNESLLNRVIALIEQDIQAAESKQDGMDMQTSKKLTDYAKTLVTLNKDAREQLKVGEWDSMTDEETQAKLEEALATLRGEEI